MTVFKVFGVGVAVVWTVASSTFSRCSSETRAYGSQHHVDGRIIAGTTSVRLSKKLVRRSFNSTIFFLRFSFFFAINVAAKLRFPNFV